MDSTPTKSVVLSHEKDWASWLKKIRSKTRLHDVVLVAEDNNGRVVNIPASRSFLALGSEVHLKKPSINVQVFEKTLYNEMLEGKTNTVSVKEVADLEAFQDLVR